MPLTHKYIFLIKENYPFKVSIQAKLIVFFAVFPYYIHNDKMYHFYSPSYCKKNIWWSCHSTEYHCVSCPEVTTLFSLHSNGWTPPPSQRLSVPKRWAIMLAYSAGHVGHFNQCTCTYSLFVPLSLTLAFGSSASGVSDAMLRGKLCPPVNGTYQGSAQQRLPWKKKKLLRIIKQYNRLH